jgi:hypothetical protein
MARSIPIASAYFALLAILVAIRRPPAMAKSRKKTFSVTKAVKANARARLGTPPPSRTLPDPKRKAAAAPRHKKTLADLLSPDKDA